MGWELRRGIEVGKFVCGVGEGEGELMAAGCGE